MFYQIVLVAISLVENLLIYLILPGIQIYVLISLVNQLSREDFLSHMAELLKSCISWVHEDGSGAGDRHAGHQKSDVACPGFPAEDDDRQDGQRYSRGGECH